MAQTIFALIQPLFQFIIDPNFPAEIKRNPRAFWSYFSAAVFGALIIINPNWAFLQGYEWALWVLLLICFWLIGRFTRIMKTEDNQFLVNELINKLKGN